MTRTSTFAIVSFHDYVKLDEATKTQLALAKVRESRRRRLWAQRSRDLRTLGRLIWTLLQATVLFYQLSQIGHIIQGVPTLPSPLTGSCSPTCPQPVGVDF